MAVTGTDISHWNEHPALDLYDFIIHKCTEGISLFDSRYDERHLWATDRGTLWGAYLFYKPEQSIVKQVHNFQVHADIQPGELVAVDFEDDETWHARSPADLASDANEIMYHLWDAYPNNRILLYCNRFTWRTIVQAYGVFLGDGLWIASPASAPQMEWVIWQHGSGSVDYDRANFATRDDMAAWLLGKGDDLMADPRSVWDVELDYEAPGSRNNPDPNHMPYSERKTAGQTVTDAYYYAADAWKITQGLAVRLDVLEGALNSLEVDIIAAFRQALADQPPDQVTLTPEQAGDLVNALPQAVQDGLREFFARASQPPE